MKISHKVANILKTLLSFPQNICHDVDVCLLLKLFVTNLIVKLLDLVLRQKEVVLLALVLLVTSSHGIPPHAYV